MKALAFSLVILVPAMAAAQPADPLPATAAADAGTAPAADTPAADSPPADAPDGDAPAADAPPTADAPAAGAPAADAPPAAPAPAPADAPKAAAAADGAKAAGDDTPQSPAELLFAEKCASCHSIGKGDRVGPDLKGAHERRDEAWLAKMIGQPTAMLSSDPDAREMLKKYKNIKMPDLGLSDDEVTMMVELIKRCSVETCNLAGVFVAVTEAGPADVERGRKLFMGEEALLNGGPPCVSCHTARGLKSSIAGGTLAKSLTHVFARLGDEGLDGAIKNPAFPLMKDIYAKRKIDKDEAFALRAFLSASNRATHDGDSISVFLVAVVGTVFCLFILNLFWRRRLRGVRKPMVHSQGAAS